MTSRPHLRTTLRGFLRDLRRTVRAHRRPLAALSAALAVLATVQAVRPPPPETAPVVVAAHDLDTGVTLSPGDVELVERPPDALPEHVYASLDEVNGNALAAPMRAGEAVTDMRLVQPGLLAGYPSGTALSSVRVTDGAALSAVHVGDEVNVVGVDPRAQHDPVVLARHAPVVALPEPTSEQTQDAVVLLAVSQTTALSLADAASSQSLTVVSIR